MVYSKIESHNKAIKSVMKLGDKTLEFKPNYRTSEYMSAKCPLCYDLWGLVTNYEYGCVSDWTICNYCLNMFKFDIIGKLYTNYIQEIEFVVVATITNWNDLKNKVVESRYDI